MERVDIFTPHIISVMSRRTNLFFSGLKFDLVRLDTCLDCMGGFRESNMTQKNNSHSIPLYNVQHVYGLSIFNESSIFMGPLWGYIGPFIFNTSHPLCWCYPILLCILLHLIPSNILTSHSRIHPPCVPFSLLLKFSRNVSPLFLPYPSYIVISSMNVLGMTPH